MISVFDIFKIIMGIIISAFILFLLMRFAGSYMEIGESSRQVSILVNFKKSIDTVYTAGESTDFEMNGSEIIKSYSPPFIETKVSFVDMSPVPLFLVPGEKLSIYRNDYDAGWWKFYFIEVLPETKILFVPLTDKEKAWPVVGNVSKLLPSTEDTKTKLKFGIGCNKTEFWFGWERYKFLDTIIPRMVTSDMSFNSCENAEYFNERGFNIVTIADEAKNSDFVVKPLDGGIGRVYIKSGDDYEEYIYKNYFDIAALMLGGKKFYDYGNSKFLSGLEVAIDVKTKELSLMTNDVNVNHRCGTDISEFVGILGSIKEIIPKIKDTVKEEDAVEFAYQMSESTKKYRELDSMGCG